jgi:hypothetical protein
VPLDADTPQHLVPHLDQVARVEELVTAEVRVPDLLGMGVNRSVLEQGLELWIVTFLAQRHLWCPPEIVNLSTPPTGGRQTKRGIDRPLLPF